MQALKSGRALDFLNFFIADAQTGFGPFVAVYLTAQKWTQVDIGFILSLGTLTALISQVPAGALVDAVRSKRAAAAAGIVSISLAAMIYAAFPMPLPIAAAELLHGFASCLVGPAIAAISLRLVDHDLLGERLGRNARFAAIGNGLAAAVLGLAGTYLSSSSVFWITALTGIPALILLRLVRLPPDAALSARASPVDWSGLRDLVTDRRLLAFGACALLFHLSNAAMLPLAASNAVKQSGSAANLIIAACVMVPQAVVAALSPWVGRSAQTRGRRSVMVLGWAALPIRGVLMALLPAPWLLIAIQVLSGVSGAVFGVALPLIAADITEKSGQLNLCMGLMGLAVFVGATISTTLAGWIADTFGESTAFLALAAAGAAGTLVAWLMMPETRSPVRSASLGRQPASQTTP